MSQKTTQTLAPDAQGLARGADILRAGGLTAFPTETVYGLGADATNDTAVARIFEAKGRPRFNPLIVHVASLDVAQDIAQFGAVATLLAAHFWPGPLTLVLPLRPGAVAPLVSAGLDSVAIRMPAHPVAQGLLAALGGPVAAPSANPSGKVSPTRAEHVLEGLDGRIDAVIDGGACAVGVESTIVLADDTAPCLLRPGGVAVEDIEAVLGRPLPVGGESATPSAPGQLASHYAPDAAVRLNVTAPTRNELWLGFGDCRGAQMNLSPKGDLVEAAANLFQMFRALDLFAEGSKGIAVAPIPETGLGRAINDRLRRAAAPRE
ncbi:MAG: L-threonylcarbamoyladenylate synthase [Brevirhabdus sp.]